MGRLHDFFFPRLNGRYLLRLGVITVAALLF